MTPDASTLNQRRALQLLALGALVTLVWIARAASSVSSWPSRCSPFKLGCARASAWAALFSQRLRTPRGRETFAQMPTLSLMPLPSLRPAPPPGYKCRSVGDSFGSSPMSFDVKRASSLTQFDSGRHGTLPKLKPPNADPAYEQVSASGKERGASPRGAGVGQTPIAASRRRARGPTSEAWA